MKYKLLIFIYEINSLNRVRRIQEALKFVVTSPRYNCSIRFIPGEQLFFPKTTIATMSRWLCSSTSTRWLLVLKFIECLSINGLAFSVSALQITWESDHRRLLHVHEDIVFRMLCYCMVDILVFPPALSYRIHIHEIIFSLLFSGFILRIFRDIKRWL